MNQDAVIKTFDDLSREQYEFLLQARNGAALSDMKGGVLNAMLDKDLVRVVNFENVKATNSIAGIVLSEDGIRVMNIADERNRDAGAGISAPPLSENVKDAEATDAQAPAPVVSEENVIPALTVEGKPAPHADESAAKVKGETNSKRR